MGILATAISLPSVDVFYTSVGCTGWGCQIHMIMLVHLYIQAGPYSPWQTPTFERLTIQPLYVVNQLMQHHCRYGGLQRCFLPYNSTSAENRQNGKYSNSLNRLRYRQTTWKTALEPRPVSWLFWRGPCRFRLITNQLATQALWHPVHDSLVITNPHALKQHVASPCRSLCSDWRLAS